MNMINVLASFLALVISIQYVIPAYADIVSLYTDKKNYVKGDQIIIYGTAEQKDKVVSLRCDEVEGSFILVHQTFVDYKNEFMFVFETEDPHTGGSRYFFHSVPYRCVATTTTFDNGKTISFHFSYDAQDNFRVHEIINGHLFINGVNQTAQEEIEKEKKTLHYFEMRSDGLYRDGVKVIDQYSPKNLQVELFENITIDDLIENQPTTNFYSSSLPEVSYLPLAISVLGVAVSIPIIIRKIGMRQNSRVFVQFDR